MKTFLAKVSKNNEDGSIEFYPTSSPNMRKFPIAKRVGDDIRVPLINDDVYVVETDLSTYFYFPISDGKISIFSKGDVPNGGFEITLEKDKVYIGNGEVSLKNSIETIMADLAIIKTLVSAITGFPFQKIPSNVINEIIVASLNSTGNNDYAKLFNNVTKELSMKTEIKQRASRS